MRHVVVVGISGLRWSDVTPAATPTLWRLAGQGSVGSLVDYAVLPLTCPADAWLTLNAGARAQSDHTNAACGAFPAVDPGRNGSRGAGHGLAGGLQQPVPQQPQLGPAGQGASLAAPPPSARAPRWRSPTPPGTSRRTCPRPPDLTAGVLARCPLTVVDLGNIGYAERSSALASLDAELARIVADLPAGSTLLVTAPGATTKPPHLQLALVDGPGYQAGLLDAASTRQPGLVVLTDLTPTVLGWLGRCQCRPARSARRSPAATGAA